MPRTGGAPARNRNALKHGLYQRYFTAAELRELERLVSPAGLAGEIAALRVALARVLGAEELGAAERLAVFGRGVDALGRALRHERVLTGERSDALLGALDQLLGELGLG